MADAVIHRPHQAGHVKINAPVIDRPRSLVPRAAISAIAAGHAVDVDGGNIAGRCEIIARKSQRSAGCCGDVRVGWRSLYRGDDARPDQFLGGAAGGEVEFIPAVGSHRGTDLRWRLGRLAVGADKGRGDPPVEHRAVGRHQFARDMVAQGKGKILGGAVIMPAPDQRGMTGLIDDILHDCPPVCCAAASPASLPSPMALNRPFPAI